MMEESEILRDIGSNVLGFNRMDGEDEAPESAPVPDSKLDAFESNVVAHAAEVFEARKMAGEVYSCSDEVARAMIEMGMRQTIAARRKHEKNMWLKRVVGQKPEFSPSYMIFRVHGGPLLVAQDRWATVTRGFSAPPYARRTDAEALKQRAALFARLAATEAAR